jgi:NitT/TauT family transport system permease protein
MTIPPFQAVVAPSRLERLAWHVGSLVMLGLVWEAAARNTVTLLLPTATRTLVAASRLVVSGEFWQALWISNQALLAGFPVACAAGVLLGLALGRSVTLARWLEVHLHILLAVPKTAVIPLIVMAFGFGLRSRAIVIFAFAFPVIAVTVQAGLQTVDARLIAMARAFCATERQIWWRVLLPAALPAVMTGLRLGLARAITGMVAVELTFVAVGLGRLLLQFRADFDAASLYATVLIVMAEAVVLMRLAAAVERRTGSFNADAMPE